MRVVYKFTMLGPSMEFELAPGAQIVSFDVDVKTDKPTFWAITDTTEKPIARLFVIRGTGDEIQDDLEYRGTCQQGPFVWHLFERSKHDSRDAK